MSDAEEGRGGPIDPVSKCHREDVRTRESGNSPAPLPAGPDGAFARISNILEGMSTKAESPPDLHHRIAERVRELRTARGLSLDALARRSGVSRSMISLIERGESNATAVVLDKLATGLGLSIAALFEFDATTALEARSPLSRRAEQTEWRDPESGYVRRNVSPASRSHPMQLVEVRFPAGARVAFETADRALRIDQQIWMLEGTMDVALGTEVHRLHEGDCLAMRLDAPTRFHNPTRRAARYLVVICAEARPR